MARGRQQGPEATIVCASLLFWLYRRSSLTTSGLTLANLAATLRWNSSYTYVVADGYCGKGGEGLRSRVSPNGSPTPLTINAASRRLPSYDSESAVSEWLEHDFSGEARVSLVRSGTRAAFVLSGSLPLSMCRLTQNIFRVMFGVLTREQCQYFYRRGPSFFLA